LRRDAAAKHGCAGAGSCDPCSSNPNLRASPEDSMPTTRTDPSPAAPAHGPVTASQIERVRMQLVSAEQTLARHEAQHGRRELRHALNELAARRDEPLSPGSPRR